MRINLSIWQGIQDFFRKAFSKRCLRPVDTEIPVSQTGIEILLALIYLIRYIEDLETLRKQETDRTWAGMSTQRVRLIVLIHTCSDDEDVKI